MVKLSTSRPAISVPAPENMGEALKTLNALANEQRLLILCLLSQGSEMTVTELNKDLDLSQSALSQHLKKLKDQGVCGFSEGRFKRVLSNWKRRRAPDVGAVAQAVLLGESDLQNGPGIIDFICTGRGAG